MRKVLRTFGTAKVHASFDTDGCLADLDKRVGKIGILSTGAPEIDISFYFFQLS